MRYIAIVYHAISDSTRRRTLKSLAEKIEKCRTPMLKDEQDLFYSSIQNVVIAPNFEKCMQKNDLVLCYFRKAIDMKNWAQIKNLLTSNPEMIPLYEHIDGFLLVGKQQKIPPIEVLGVFMEYARRKNKYFVELEDFENVFPKVMKFCSATASVSMFDNKLIERSYISDQSVDILKKRIDEYVKDKKQGFVKIEEYEQVRKEVTKWKKQKRIRNGQGVVVVDALNFGGGGDPKSWERISAQFDHVFFATRSPPKKVREEVLKRYNGTALYCDKLSTDDLVILKMALEFGPMTSLVTNDRYRDHRREICDGDCELEQIWDDFMIDAVYRHFDGRIENRRDFNLRVRKVGQKWFVPVLDSEGRSPEFRKLKIYCIEQKLTSCV
ncbi:hypothetical protein CAEBREN_21154 [Caenorhabditis brenneri]|uniref:PRORP domain-containing protein n=1 Tax=Caenorhabditis brenneri TaxID=135651 RepID=G0NXW1_CAEBE|nr:hypothetical protein CAEBREN_21154 [Caenorhabditis brenneri]